MNIFMIGTAHQYHQVEMAVRCFCLDKKDIYLLVEDLGVEKVFQDSLRSAGFGAVIFFKSWVFKDVFMNPRFSKDFIAICRSIGSTFTSINLYTSHYDSDYCLLADAILQPKKIFLMDEGTASFETVIARRSRRGKNLRLFIKSLLYRVPIKSPSRITYFTKYHLKPKFPDDLWLYSDAKIDNPLVSVDEDVVVVLGSSIVEVGLLRGFCYFELMKKVRLSYPGKSIRYYPHRKESIHKLQKIKVMGFEIIKNDQPFEKLFAVLENVPHVIASVYTSGVLDNLSARYNNLPDLVLYKFDDGLLLKNRDVYADIFNHLMLNDSLIIKEI